MTAEHLTAIDVTQIGLRTDPDALPFEPPEPNRATTWNGRDVLWLGPAEWLVVGGPGEAAAIQRELEDAVSERHRSILDLGANRTAFDLTDGLEFLSSACGLDLDPSRWRPGMCAQTLFGEAQVILQQRDERTTRVFVRPSFATYFGRRLGFPSNPRDRRAGDAARRPSPRSG